MTRRLTIAIDGPAAGGKGTIALRLAEALGYTFVDTGAMYRAVAWIALQRQIPLDDAEALGKLAEELEIAFQREEVEGRVRYRILADGEDISGDIRRPEVDRASSIVAQYPAVRKALVAKQRALAREGGVVMEGRDITTVVLPDADIKFFITASLEERARRRYTQRLERGLPADLAAIEQELAERDRRDSERPTAPMRIAPDAIVIDTTDLDVDTSVALVIRLVQARAAARAEPATISQG